MKKKHISLFIVVIILPLIFIVNATSFFVPIRDYTISFMSPVIDGCHFIFFNLFDGVGRISQLGDIIRSYEKMKGENETLRARLVEFNEVKAENERLTELLNLEKIIITKHISAQIIGRDVSPWSQWVVLNIGYQEGAAKDMPLVSKGGVVGRIVSVGYQSSRAMLLVDAQSKMSAIVQETREMGIVEGTSTAVLRMKYLSINSDVQVGDTVVTSGLGGVYPKGLPIGKIITVGAEKNGLHLFAEIRPFVNFSKLEEVICLVKSK